MTLIKRSRETVGYLISSANHCCGGTDVRVLGSVAVHGGCARHNGRLGLWGVGVMFEGR